VWGTPQRDNYVDHLGALPSLFCSTLVGHPAILLSWPPSRHPLTDFDNRMRHTTTMAPADRDFLLRRSAELAIAVTELHFALPPR
jgi:hypothetical protein